LDHGEILNLQTFFEANGTQNWVMQGPPCPVAPAWPNHGKNNGHHFFPETSERNELI
jgi:hypothetical protein